MPEIKRNSLPKGVMAHLLKRIYDREISAADLETMTLWIDTNPIVPEGMWYKEFPTFTLAGNGPLVSTFLTSSMKPKGQKVV